MQRSVARAGYLCCFTCSRHAWQLDFFILFVAHWLWGGGWLFSMGCIAGVFLFSYLRYLMCFIQKSFAKCFHLLSDLWGFLQQRFAWSVEQLSWSVLLRFVRGNRFLKGSVGTLTNRNSSHFRCLSLHLACSLFVFGLGKPRWSSFLPYLYAPHFVWMATDLRFSAIDS